MGREFQGRMRLKKKKKNPGWVHFTAYGGHVCHVTAREHCGDTGVQADRNHCLAIKRELFHTYTQNVRKKTASPCKVLSARFTVHLHFSRWMRVCVCDVIHSFSYSAGGPGPVPALGGCRSVYFCRLAGTWDFLWVYCGWSTCKQHGPSSLLLLPLQAASAPAPPLLRITCAEGNPT